MIVFLTLKYKFIYGNKIAKRGEESRKYPIHTLILTIDPDHLFR